MYTVIKRTSFILIMICTCMLVGCSSKDNEKKPDNTFNESISSGEDTTTVQSEPEPTSGGDALVLTEQQIEEAQKVAVDYYKGTVFTVNNIKYLATGANDGSENPVCKFAVNVSKGGVVQEPDRTIMLQLENGSWKVVNEGY